jgi:hypothetical protein
MREGIRSAPSTRRGARYRPVAAKTVILLSALVAVPAATAEPPGRTSDSSVYELTGRAKARDAGASSGGDLTLSGAIRAPALAGGDYRLNAFPASDLALAPDGALCFCGDVIFTDDFELGHAGAWSVDFP